MKCQARNPQLILTLTLLICAAAGGNSVQADDWPMFRGNYARDGWQREETQLTPPLKIKWSALRGEPELPDTNLIIEASPLIHNGRVYVATIIDQSAGPAIPEDQGGPVPAPDLTSAVVCLDLETGHYLWSTVLADDIWNGGIWATPSLNEDGTILYAGNFEGNLYALDTVTGDILWQRALAPFSPRALRQSPVVKNNRVYVGTYESQGGNNGRLFILDALTGDTIAEQIVSGNLYASPVLAMNDFLIVLIRQTDQKALLRVYDISTDTLDNVLWERTLAGDAYSTPVYANGKLFHRAGIVNANGTAPEGRLYVFDIWTGIEVIPPYPVNGSTLSSPAIDTERIYMATGYPFSLIAVNSAALLNAESSPQEWQFFLPDGGVIMGSPTVANGVIYVSTDDNGDPAGVFYALDAATGKELWRHQGDDGIGSAQASPAVADGTVVFASYDDRQGIEHGVFAFTTDTSSPDNRPPDILSGPVASPNPVSVGQTAQISVSAWDPDGDLLTYRWSASTGNIIGDGPSVKFIPPPVNTPAHCTVTVDISDGTDAGTSAKIDIAVEPVNQPPVITSGPTAEPSSLNVKMTAQLSVAAFDPEGRSLTYDWSTTAGTIQGEGARVTFLPPRIRKEITVIIHVRVQDTEGATATASTSVEVQPNKGKRGNHRKDSH